MEKLAMLPFFIQEDDDGGSSEVCQALLPSWPNCSLCDTGQTMMDKTFVQL